MLIARIAEEFDCESVYFWRNHPSTRSYFFNKNPVSFFEHRLWFEKVMRDDNIILYIIEDTNDGPLGVVRFDLDKNSAEVHIYLVPNRQQQGLGLKVLNVAVEKLILEHSISELICRVLPDNIASIKLFNKAGFVGVAEGLYIKKL